MPVNMDPKKKRKTAAGSAPSEPGETPKPSEKSKGFGEATDRDREHALADAEWKNLWDATEVIDMDKW